MNTIHDNDQDDDSLLVEALIRYEKEIKQLRSSSRISLNNSLIDLTNDIEYEHIIHNLKSCFDTNTAFELFGQDLVNMDISNDLEDLYNIIQPFNSNTNQSDIIRSNSITDESEGDFDQYNMYGGSINP